MARYYAQRAVARHARGRPAFPIGPRAADRPAADRCSGPAPSWVSFGGSSSPTPTSAYDAAATCRIRYTGGDEGYLDFTSYGPAG